ncbi:Hypothetical predicted protein, partial [Paramuricea clavata]
MSSYKNSSKTVEGADTSSVSLMYHTSKDNQYNDGTKDTENNYATILDDNGHPEVIYIGKTSRVSRFVDFCHLTTGESEMFDELGNAIQNRNLEKLHNVMNELDISDKVKMLLHCPRAFLFIEANGCLIIQAMFFDLDCFKYLLELYEKLKPALEALETQHLMDPRHGPVTLYPFRMANYSSENLLHYMRGENNLIAIEYLSKCTVFDQLINRPHKPQQNMTPLSMAIVCDEIPLALKMVELGGYIDSVNSTGESPIYEAVIYSHMDLMKTMLNI